MTKTTSTLNFVQTDADTRVCGPYVIERVLNDSGNLRRYDVFAGDEAIGSGRNLTKAQAHAEAHWMAAGCPAITDGMEMFQAEPEPEETKKEVLARIQRNFKVMSRLVKKAISGAYTSLIISGPGGIGKSHPTKAALRDADVDHVEVSGKMTAPGLFKALWAVKDGGVLLIDDCDSVFEDSNALNLLKAALDSSDRRVISWFSQGSWIEDEGMEPQFEFCGQVIFITNIDFDAEIEKGTKRSAHLEALLSRSVLMDLDIKSTRDLLVRIEDMVINVGMVDKFGLTEEQKRDLVDFMEEHANKFRSLTLREAVKMAKMIAADETDDGSEWRDEALVTLAKGRRRR